jgi:hypothetical protein
VHADESRAWDVACSLRYAPCQSFGDV